MAIARAATRSPARRNSPVSLKSRVIEAANSPGAKILYVSLGAVGLTALAIAILGPKRLNRRIIVPVRHAVGDQAERLWVDSRPLRDQLGKLFDQVQSESGREKLARSFQSWIGHFRAS